MGDTKKFNAFNYVLSDIGAMYPEDLATFLALLIQILFNNKALTEENVRNIFDDLYKYQNNKINKTNSFDRLVHSFDASKSLKIKEEKIFGQHKNSPTFIKKENE